MNICGEFEFSWHALQRAQERRISGPDIIGGILFGTVIEESNPQLPNPTFLVLFYLEDEPWHVLYSMDFSTRRCYIITVYRPDPERWESDFKTRRTP